MNIPTTIAIPVYFGFEKQKYQPTVLQMLKEVWV